MINKLKEMNNFTTTENGAVTRKSTNSALMDMFALGGAYRSRSEEDCILLFKKAYEENPEYALKCLFYLGDARGGQGERRFYRICFRWLANTHTEAARRNMNLIPEYRRWDDLYILVGTPLETEAFDMMKAQLALDVQTETPSLLAKWLASENTSSSRSRFLANKTRIAFGMTHKQYRKTLSILRGRIKVLEKLMSANEWGKIEFDKIPSQAGFRYRKAFIRHDVDRPEASISYADFMKDSETKVNASVLYPYECVHSVLSAPWLKVDSTERRAINKYWDNLTDYFNEATFDGIAVVDVSGSMMGWSADAPINVAVSLGLYCAERVKGPYAGHFITFSRSPKFVEVEGIDFYDKARRLIGADWGFNTNIEATFDLLLNIAIKNNLKQEDIMKNIIIISDMEFDMAVRGVNGNTETLMEGIAKRWAEAGYQIPKLTFWNVAARQNNIPMRDDGYVRYVSGMSPVIYTQIMKDMSAEELMYDVLNSERYAPIK